MGTVYTQLSITERRKIERWMQAKVQPFAERHSREHKPTPSKVAALRARHPALHRSRYEGDL
jgi:hypothetical protein